MKLAPGSRVAIEVEPLERGRLRVSLRARVGNSGSRDLAPARICAGWPEAWVEIEILAQERLAQLGLETVRGSRERG